MIKFSLIIIAILAVFSINTFAKEELTIVQIVSNNRHTFVIQKGLKDGISRGIEVIFGNENSSIVCRAIEVSREYSLWAPVDKFVNVPFNKLDVISLNTHAFGNIAVDVGNGKQNISSNIDNNKVYAKIRTEDDWSVRYSYGGAVAQSSSSVSTSQNSKKISEDFDAEYGFRMSPEIEFSIGARLNYALYRLSAPVLDVSTNRNFLMSSFVFHFVNLSDNQNNIYAGISLGIGKSTTTLDNKSSSGLAYVLPQLRLGYLIPFTKTLAFIGETSIESIVSRENFSNGSAQNNSDINVKLSIGLRF